MQLPSKIRTEDTNHGGDGDEEQGISTAAATGLQTLAWHVHLCAAPARGGSELLHLLGMGGKQHPILTDVAGETHAGQCTAVLGPSGCGKTTLLECIALRRRGFAGSIYVDGQPATPAYLQRMSKWLCCLWDRTEEGDSHFLSMVWHTENLFLGRTLLAWAPPAFL